jgi:hypothetical protein
MDINHLDLREEDVSAERIDLVEELRDWLPRPGDGLIEETESALRVDPLGYSDPCSPGDRSPVGRWGLYSRGFLDAGDRLVDGLTGGPCEDELLYPILFSYRQHIELEVKGRVYGCLNHRLSELSEKDISGIKEWLKKTHRLQGLWDTLKRCSPDCQGEFGAATRMAFEGLLAELDGIDPNGQASRYPVDQVGGQTLLGRSAVDAQVLKKRVHQMSNYLTAIQEDMYLALESRNEMASW